jgi:hypothetical protein
MHAAALCCVSLVSDFALLRHFSTKKLKPLQNKKGQEKFPDAHFSVSFSQLPAIKKLCTLNFF